MKPRRTQLKLVLRLSRFRPIQPRCASHRNPGVPFKLQVPDRLNLCKWVHEAWNDIAPATIILGFKTCGLIDAPEDIQEAEPVQIGDAETSVNVVLDTSEVDQEVGIFV